MSAEQMRLRKLKDKAGAEVLDLILRCFDLNSLSYFLAACDYYRSTAERLATYNESRARR